MAFNIGDVVSLKSGGPDMTVSALKGGEATCVWFKDLEPIYKVFVTDTLEAKASRDAKNNAAIAAIGRSNRGDY